MFFGSSEEMFAWLQEHHDQKPEVFVGFHKKGSGKSGIDYAGAVAVALCFGWIDSVIRPIDDLSYALRFTPRKPGSIWSQVNIRRYCELLELGRVHPAGKKTFDERDEKKQMLYSFEQEKVELGAYEKKFRANKKAWANFNKMAPSYRRPATWWVISAKQEETRERRLKTLIECSEKGERIPPLRRPGDQPGASKKAAKKKK